MEKLNLLELLESISVITAACVAIYGINSWRREARWKREYDLAEEVLALFYEARDKIAVIRSAAGHTNEGQTRKRSGDESEEESMILDMAYVAFERYEKHQETFNTLRKLKYRFMAVFGKEAGEPIHKLNIVLTEILSAARLLGSIYWMQQGRRSMSEQEKEKHLEKMHIYEAKFWAGIEPDEISARVEVIITDVEAICQRVIDRKKHRL